MPYKIAINGFGQIGRIVLRQLLSQFPFCEVVAVNDLSPPKTLANLFRFDSTYGRFEGEVGFDDDLLVVDDSPVRIFAERDTEQLPWSELGIDLVVEAGLRLRRQGERSYESHLTAGAQRVLVTGMAVEPDMFWVAGVNDDTITEHYRCVSLGGRVLHSLAPICKIIDDHFGLVHGTVTATLPISEDQAVLDSAYPFAPYARTAAINVVVSPVPTDWNLGAAIPVLKGKVTGLNYRVPVYGGAILQLTGETRIEVDTHTLSQCVAEAAGNRFQGLVTCTGDPLVSQDALRQPQSCLFDMNLTFTHDAHRFRVAWWFDPTWSLAARCVELVRRLTDLGGG